jgi:Spy/CpxP family protein refolding chaperone
LSTREKELAAVPKEAIAPEIVAAAAAVVAVAAVATTAAAAVAAAAAAGDDGREAETVTEIGRQTGTQGTETVTGETRTAIESVADVMWMKLNRAVETADRAVRTAGGRKRT